ncbi:hypothetical protein Tco_0799041 [Tanacetum coccineum]
MVDLKFVDQHNMVACLEKTEENVEFHQIVDFLSTCSINYALTVYGAISETSCRSDLSLMNEMTSVPLDHGADEAVHKEGVTVAVPGAKKPWRGGALTQTRSKRVLEKPKEPPLLEGHTFRSGEGRMEHTFELMDTIPHTPHDSPLLGGYTPGSDEDPQTKAKSQEIRKKEEVKHLTPKKEDIQADSDFDVLDDDMEDVEGETVHTATTGVSVVSAPVTTAGIAISTAEPRTPPTTATTAFIDEDLTIAQTLIKMKEEKTKEKGVAIKDLAQRLHEEELAELDRAQKERQKQEEATSAALAEEFDEIQARIDADHELAVRLTHEEQEKYTIEERARLLAEFFERRKKQLAAERAEAIRNKPPTRTQVRNRMITYLKHMGKYTHQQLKHKNFEEVQKLYEREKKWIDDFKPIDDDSQQQAESTKKRPRADSEEESSKK